MWFPRITSQRIVAGRKTRVSEAGRNEAAREDLVTAVRRGNLPFFDCFYDSADSVMVISEVYVGLNSHSGTVTLTVK